MDQRRSSARRKGQRRAAGALKRQAGAGARRETLLVRGVKLADIPHVIALDERVTGLAKPDYWLDVFRGYGFASAQRAMGGERAGADRERARRQ